MIGYWALLQLLSGVVSLGAEGEAGEGIAFWAHVAAWSRAWFSFAFSRATTTSKSIAHTSGRRRALGGDDGGTYSGT
jgi:membrane associated rhomboid family serine protease